MRSDSVKNVSAYADQNHAPSLAAARLEWIVELQYVFNNYSSAGSSVVFSLGGITSEKIKKAINAATKPGTIGWLK